MSDFRDFVGSRILRNPTTWIAAAIGGAYGGIDMVKARRVAHAGAASDCLWLHRSFDFCMGATIQIVVLMCTVWMVAGLLEKTNAWIRQSTVFALYLGINWMAKYL